jgi:hypothetical protein
VIAGVLAVVLLLAAAVLVLVVGVGRWWVGGSDFADAVSAAPAGTERISWTDWDGVRRELGSDLDDRSSAGAVEDFLDEAFDGDLTSRSALVQSAPVLQSDFGFSPASVSWEMFSQGPAGAAITLGMPRGTDFGEIADDLESLGYVRPDSATGVWAGGPDLLPSIGADLTPELAYLVLDEDEYLVVASDQQAYAETAHRAATGDGHRVAGLDAVARALEDPLAAAVYAGDYACGALAMGQADEADQAEAARLVSAAGTVDPYRAFAMGVRSGGEVRVAMEFANDDQARANADSRAVLATGPAVGQGGDFADRFSLASATADGPVVRLDLTPARGAYVLSDLSTGPLLFATC